MSTKQEKWIQFKDWPKRNRIWRYIKQEGNNGINKTLAGKRNIKFYKNMFEWKEKDTNFLIPYKEILLLYANHSLIYMQK